MKKILVLSSFFLLLALSKINAQTNLVPNGDFEIYSSLPTDYGQCNRAVGWNNVNGHYPFVQGYGTPDFYYLSSFMTGYGNTITPIWGNGQMGLVTYNTGSIFREYISNKLITG